MGSTIYLIAGTALAWVGLILDIVGLATTHWLESPDGEAHLGLFKTCIKDDCSDFDIVYYPWYVVKYFNLGGTVIGAVGCVIAVVALFLTLKSKDVAKYVRRSASNLPIAASLLVIIAVVVLAAKIKDSSLDYGYSFILAIVGSILIGLGGIANWMWKLDES